MVRKGYTPEQIIVTSVLFVVRVNMRLVTTATPKNCSIRLP
jgi:hypothetical protein